MKSINRTQWALTSLFCLLFSCTQAQRPIPCIALAVSDQQTSNLIFPYRIVKTDLGSADLLGHQDAKLDHVLFIKAARKEMLPTNLSVYTSDGKAYFFRIHYATYPDTLNLAFGMNTNEKIVPFDQLNEAFLDTTAAAVQVLPPSMRHACRKQQIQLSLQGMYTHDQMVWLTLSIRNRSPFVYQPIQWQFSINQKHRPKRTAAQQRFLNPIWKEPLTNIASGEQTTSIVGLPVFVIPRDKKLIIEVSEDGGQRPVQLSVTSHLLTKTKHF